LHLFSYHTEVLHVPPRDLRSWLGLHDDSSGHHSEASITADSFASESGIDSEEYEERLRRKHHFKIGALRGPSEETQVLAATVIQRRVSDEV